jgi:hypothetical protein
MRQGCKDWFRVHASIMSDISDMSIIPDISPQTKAPAEAGANLAPPQEEGGGAAGVVVFVSAGV